MYYPENPTSEIYISYEDKYEEAQPSFSYDANPVESYGTVAFIKPITDNLIQSEVNLTQGDKIQDAKVIGCTKYPNGKTVVKYNYNPLFNSI